jgi:hypothetical protein
MNRKMGGFILFAATSMSFLGTAIIRQEQLPYTILAVVMIFLALAGLKNHFKELR